MEGNRGIYIASFLYHIRVGKQWKLPGTVCTWNSGFPTLSPHQTFDRCFFIVLTASHLIFLGYNRGNLQYRSLSYPPSKNIFICIHVLPVVCNLVIRYKNLVRPLARLQSSASQTSGCFRQTYSRPVASQTSDYWEHCLPAVREKSNYPNS
jgi:hypothetical protein